MCFCHQWRAAAFGISSNHLNQNRGFRRLHLEKDLYQFQIFLLCMVTDAEGQVSDAINLQNVASKGKSGGVVWMNKDLKAALEKYQSSLGSVSASERIIRTERNASTSAQVIINLLYDWYKRLGFDG